MSGAVKKDIKVQFQFHGPLKSLSSKNGHDSKVGLKSREEYKPGDVIQKFSEPIVKVLDEHAKGVHCDLCFLLPRNGKKVSTCGGCHLQHYCGKDCQKKDWKVGHRFECKSPYFLRRPATANNAKVSIVKRKIFRLYALLRSNPKIGSKEFEMYDKSTLSLNAVIARHKTQFHEPQYILFADSMSKALVIEGIPAAECSRELILKIAGLWAGYSIPIRNETDTETIGSGIYMEPFAYAHSCKPTAFININCHTVEMRAATNIPRTMRPTFCYLRSNKDFQTRKSMLKHQFGLICGCDRCCVESKKSLIDYDKLEQMERALDDTDDPEDYYELHEKIVEMLKKLYYEFDPRISYRYFWTYRIVAFARFGPGVEKVLKKVAKTAENQILTTFGKTHINYLTFQAIKLEALKI